MRPYQEMTRGTRALYLCILTHILLVRLPLFFLRPCLHGQISHLSPVASWRSTESPHLCSSGHPVGSTDFTSFFDYALRDFPAYSNDGVLCSSFACLTFCSNSTSHTFPPFPGYPSAFFHAIFPCKPPSPKFCSTSLEFDPSSTALEFCPSSHRG